MEKQFKYIPDLSINTMQLAYILGYIGLQVPESLYNALPPNLQQFFREVVVEVIDADKVKQSKS